MKTLVALNLAAMFFAPAAFAATTRSSEDGSTKVLIFVAILGAAVVLGIVGVYLDKVRSDKIETFARSIGCTYRRKATEADAGLPSGCQMGTLGHGKIVSNVLEAAQTPELAFTLFDYQYTIGYGRSSQTHQQTVSRMQSSLLHLPMFLLFPETMLSKFGDTIMGRKDIDFSDSPVFSEAFILRGDDEIAVRALFSSKLRQALEATPKLTIEGNADRLFIFRADHRIKPEEFSATIEEDKRIAALFFEAQRSTA